MSSLEVGECVTLALCLFFVCVCVCFFREMWFIGCPFIYSSGL